MLLAEAFPPHMKTLASFLIALRATRGTRSIILKIFLLLCGLNWRNLPLVWHIRAFSWLPRYRLRLYLISKGLLRPPREARGPALGLKPVERGLISIGRSPFAVTQATDEFVSIGDTDFNLHMSNSVYATAGDFNRFAWSVQAIGPSLRQERITWALAETDFIYLREIPMFSSYRHELALATYDHQWMWLYARFLIPVSRRARNNPSFIKVKDSQGKECVLAACGLSRCCLKLRGHPRSVHPARLFLLGGPGEDASTWEFAKDLKRNRQTKKFLLDEGTPEQMQIYEERRLAGLELVNRLSDKAAWIELDRLVHPPQ